MGPNGGSSDGLAAAALRPAAGPLRDRGDVPQAQDERREGEQDPEVQPRAEKHRQARGER